MNSDRLTQMSSDDIVAGLTTKWNGAYSFLGFTFSSTPTDNDVTFDSLNQNQFAKDIAHYLEPEDLFFLLFQTTDKYISVTDGINILLLTDSNIKQMLIHKWKKGITQLNSALISLSVDGEYLIWNYSMLIGNTNNNKESVAFMTKTVLGNYLESYFKFENMNTLYPILTFKYKINWDNIKSRFSSRMSMNLGHNLFVQDEGVVKTLCLYEKYRIYTILDGSLSNICTFVSSNAAIANVDQGGLITCLSEGVCYITVTDSLYNISQQFNLVVKNHTIKLSSDYVYLYQGQTKKLTAFIDDSKSSNITYISSNPNIVDVDTSGVLLCGSLDGSCVITVTDNLYGLVKKCYVHKQLSELSLNSIGNFNLVNNKSFQLIAYYNGEKAKNVTYSSSDNTLATVSSTGLIKSINSSKEKKTCAITVTNNITGDTVSIVIITYNFDIATDNLLAYWSAVRRTNNDVNYSTWYDLTGNGNDMVPYSNETQNNTGLFSNKATAGWQNNWFVFDSVSTANKGHWRITPSPFLLTPNKNLAFAIRFKANYISGYPSMFSVRSGTNNHSFSFYQSQAQNTFQFETGIYDASTKFTYVNASMTDTTIAIQTVSEVLANVYVNGVKTTTVKITKLSLSNLFATIGAERQGSMGNFFNGAIKAIALYDTTTVLKTDVEMVQLSQDLMALS